MSIRSRGPPVLAGSVKVPSSKSTTALNSNTGTFGTKLENSYQVQPSATFPATQIREVTQEILHGSLAGVSYDASTIPRLTMEVASAVRNRVKQIECFRFKLVVFVTITENKGSSVKLASRCVWNEKYDRFVDCSYQNSEVHATAVVFAVYQE